jgi:hypothetical protein
MYSSLIELCVRLFVQAVGGSLGASKQADRIDGAQ